MTSRRPDPSAGLPDSSLRLIEGLALQPPNAVEPGYWKTADGFIAVNTGVLRDGPPPHAKLRALISFAPGDVHQATKDRVREKIPNGDHLTKEQRFVQWAMILKLGKEARTERVGQILGEMANLGVLLDYESVIVHRVSNTFFASVDRDTLVRIVALRAEGFAELRRMVISSVAASNVVKKARPGRR